MSWGQAVLSQGVSCFVGIQGLLGSETFLFSGGVFCDISVIITFHFLEEHLTFLRLTFWKKMVVKKIQDISANLSELILNHLFVILCFFCVLGSTFLVLFSLNESDHSPGCSPCSNHIFESYGQNVSLVNGELFISSLGKLLDILNHF